MLTVYSTYKSFYKKNMFIINYIREKYHPLFRLFEFRLFRKIYKLKIIYLKKSKIFGKFFLYLPRGLNLLININNFEKETFDFIKTLNYGKKLENTSVIDVGGNIGMYSFFFKNNYNPNIYLFEPDEDNLILLFKTKKENKFNNFNIFPFAVSNKQKISEFLVDDITGFTGTLSSSLNVPQAILKLDTKKNVICVKLDSFKDIINKVSWIKIDIEGHEFEALEGMIELIKRDQPNLIIEVSAKNIDKILKLLHPLHYKIKKIKKDPNYIFYKQDISNHY
tara:strand:- start:114 stop:950 length:837 start_codon:yes stop_codon:yes gene_type:complete